MTHCDRWYTGFYTLIWQNDNIESDTYLMIAELSFGIASDLFYINQLLIVKEDSAY